MFGYIRPYKPELKLKEINKYAGAYCTLCDQLKRDYGFASRFILNYDITFLLLYLNSINDDNKEERKIRCPYNPLKVKRSCLSQEALRYCAFINYWLVTEKSLDDYTDDKNVFKGLLRKVLISKNSFKSAKQTYAEKVQVLESLLREVYQSETGITDSFTFDKVTNTFGDFFSEIFITERLDEKTDLLLKKLFFQVGKWIYIVDAYNDFAQDVKKHKFNLLCSLLEEDNTAKADVFESAFSIHLQIKHKINLLLKELKDVLKDECLTNILTFGLDNVFYEITKKQYKEQLERLTNNGSSILEQLGTEN